MSFDFIKNKDKKVHFIGIGGISMSGLAEILLENGYKVSGSDRSSTPITEKLKSKGATIYIGHNENNILEADLVVYTAAIPSNNPEIKKAKELNIALMDRAEFLGHVMKGHKYNVSISGTHGKTTTTSMLSHIVLKANLDPTILVGGELDVINGNVRAGKSEYFLTEACEYKASFLKFQPTIGVILNIDSDHLDFYKDIDDIENTFLKFAHLIPKDGFLIANFDDDRVKRVSSKINCNIISYGLDNGNLQAKNISYDSMGSSTFDVFKNEDFLLKIELNVPGKHNIQNALAAIGAALSLNIDEKSICEGLKDFKSPHRRFEKKGIKNGITVIDDYAHHPTEIKAALNAAKNYPHKKIICVFQPHTYSRTKRLFNEFATSFNYATEVILADIYAAREIDNGEINSEMLSNAIKEQGIKTTNIHDFEDIVKYLKDISTEGDLILTVGAGDVFKVGEMFLK